MVGTLIVGASQAGVQLATSLRELGDVTPIALVGSEAHTPYQRPPLSKGYLSGNADLQTLSLRSEAWYLERGIDLVCGETIVDIRLPDKASPGVAMSASGRRFEFDRLALTVGGRARRIAVPGHDLDGVCYLRSIDDARDLRHRLETAESVVVIGGGFIGLEAAAAGRTAGKAVTVVDVADRLLGRAVAPVVSEFYLQAHRRRGTEVLLGTRIAAIRGFDGRVTGVELGDGHTLPADLVLVGIGLEPRAELAKRMGLEVDGGIVVDAAARTSHPGVVAAGDCTVTVHPDYGAVRVESVQNAIGQAKAAAATLLGREAPKAGVPWFWSDQAGLKLQIAGLNHGSNDVVVRGDPNSETFSAVHYRDGQVISVDAVNAPRDYMAIRKLLETGGNVPRDAAADPDISLKEYLNVRN